MRLFFKFVLPPLALVALLLGFWGWGVFPVPPPPSWGDDLPLGSIKLPAGFKVSLYARVPGARSLCWGEKGTLFVGTRRGKVFALRPGKEGRPVLSVVAAGLHEPNGVAFKNGALWVADVDRVLRYPGLEDRLDDPPAGEVVSDRLPGDGHHGWRYARFGPDGLLYIAVGAPCNVCQRPDPFASIIAMREDGVFAVFARGIRNTVGFDWRPRTRAMWFSNNGRDWLGDDQPPDSLHRAAQPGLHFGFPFCHAGFPDPDLNRGRGCERYAPPALKLPAHVAALGMRFYTGKMFPKQYQGAIFLAEHGSWNRKTPVGYRVSLVTLKGDQVARYQSFASGWLKGATAWGRPVDVEVDREGALLISDDRAGAIYRVTFSK